MRRNAGQLLAVEGELSRQLFRGYGMHWTSGVLEWCIVGPVVPSGVTVPAGLCARTAGALLPVMPFGALPFVQQLLLLLLSMVRRSPALSRRPQRAMDLLLPCSPCITAA